MTMIETEVSRFLMRRRWSSVSCCQHECLLFPNGFERYYVEEVIRLVVVHHSSAFFRELTPPTEHLDVLTVGNVCGAFTNPVVRVAGYDDFVDDARHGVIIELGDLVLTTSNMSDCVVSHRTSILV